MRKFSGQRKEPFFQSEVAASPYRGVSCVREIYENESFPRRQVYWAEGVISLIETWNFVHVRRADQSSVECIRPGVIWALNRADLSAWIGAKPRAAMSANIVKSAN